MCITQPSDLLDELKQDYSTGEAEQLYCSAVLRSCYPGIRNSKLRDKYIESYLSEIYTHVALSKNSIGELLERVGKANLRMKDFMKRRMDKVEPSHHVIVDGTLKKNKSIINDFSEFSRKIGSDYPMISVIYAFDLELMEPLTMEVYPGNMIDARAFSDFVKNNSISCGIIVVDKGFPRSSAEEVLESIPDLHYLIPLKDNNFLIKRYCMLDFDKVSMDMHIFSERKFVWTVRGSTPSATPAGESRRRRHISRRNRTISMDGNMSRTAVPSE